MRTVFIVHGTEGYPEENWFPWLKERLEALGHKVFVPQFPSLPVVPAKVSEWFDVLKDYEKYIDHDTIFIGHSLGGIFTLRALEKIKTPIKAAIFVGTPIGVRPILHYDRDSAFSGFDFDWETIKTNARHFVVFQSDDDPYVSLANGKELSEHLGVELSFIANAGHFNKRAGYLKFDQLLRKLEPLLVSGRLSAVLGLSIDLTHRPQIGPGKNAQKTLIMLANVGHLTQVARRLRLR